VTGGDDQDETGAEPVESKANGQLPRRSVLGGIGAVVGVGAIGGSTVANAAQDGDDDPPSSISYGSVTWGEVTEDDPEGYGGHYDSVTFQGERGDVIAIRVYGTDYDLELVQGGTTIAEGESFTSGQAEGVRIPNYGLGVSDEYTIVVAASDPGSVGAYQLELEKVRSVDVGGGSEPDAAFTARVVDARENPLDGGTVQVYRDADDERLASAEIDASGWVALDADALAAIEAAERVHVLASAGDWFDGYTFEADAVGEHEGENLPLRREVLYGPELAASGDGPLGVVSVWRQVGFPDPAVQTVCVEVTNTAGADEPSNVGSRAFDLTSGVFSVSYPEDDLLVSYGEYTDVEHPREMDVASVPTPHEGSMNVERDDRPMLPVEVYHPARTGVPMGGTSIVEYADLETSEAEETVNEGAGRVVSSLPFVGMALDVGDLLHWGFGDPVERSASLGVEDPAPVDPNDWDTASLPWTSDSRIFEEASVLGVFPIRLDADGPTTIDVRAEWTLESPLFGFGTGSGSFARTFEIGPR
jgi:hypothetical protein